MYEENIIFLQIASTMHWIGHASDMHWLRKKVVFYDISNVIDYLHTYICICIKRCEIRKQSKKIYQNIGVYLSSTDVMSPFGSKAKNGCYL